jgi:protoheme IX farnesyltransferase
MRNTATLMVTALPAMRTRAQDYLELTKPRLSLMVLLTVAVGAFLASRGPLDLVLLMHVLVGTGLVVAGASAFNQYLERDSDALMQRTENRPLPAGRLSALEVSIAGLALALTGFAYLGLGIGRPLAAAVAAVAFFSYVFVYTPLKRRTTLNTLVGAVPGALPPIIGWTAVRGTIDREAVVLFLLLFFWQVPHFLAIAWIYREDYRRAGLCMLPVGDADGAATSRQMVSYCLALIPVSLLPAVLRVAGPVYWIAAMTLGIGFLVPAIAFARRPSLGCARRVLRASLVYLPAILVLLALTN